MTQRTGGREGIRDPEMEAKLVTLARVGSGIEEEAKGPGV